MSLLVVRAGALRPRANAYLTGGWPLTRWNPRLHRKSRFYDAETEDVEYPQ